MSFLAQLNWSRLLKITGTLGLYAGAFYNLTIGNFEQASQALGLAMVASGFTSSAIAQSERGKIILDDLANIRNNPAMPGTPLTAPEVVSHWVAPNSE